MKTRFDFAAVAPEAMKAAIALEMHCKNSGLPARLFHLIKLRASIINGCSYCVDMHAKESRADGLSEQWIRLVSAWHESTVFTDEERAVLAFTDSLTLVAQTRAPDEDYDELRKFFSEAEIAKIIMVIGAINVWNRIAVGTRKKHPVDAAAKAA
ncbi:alkylhydroperoxidase [Pseudolabrys sp. Root1462]|jgi:AhpD family alkylhydroperoxidase|uniref:carboxymuconolactone decarboxylase family protein n=1 Tax=Pseudolabrys sp. Root1462 TaxID=1736466 RepID=UPI0007024D20|nr:carboxymuconolactone decarboxylase family protein [Pseudolabrys sp. Root1462]KQZ01311.1 alkylhydroperoxidase [Pseudolabrys sp. Root1462]